MSFFTSLFCFGCKSVPQYDAVQEKFPPVNFDSDENLLKLYFPTFCDSNGKVIGGDGIVILFPDKSCMVIDGFYSAAASDYIAFLKNLGVTKIDSLVLTHFHGDHIGSFPALLDAFPVQNVYTNGGHITSDGCTKFLNKLSEKKLEEKILQQGDELSFGTQDKTCSIKVYSPLLTDADKDKLLNNPGRTAKFINNSSLVFKLSYKDFSILFTGDVYKNHDRELSAQYGEELHSTFLKLPHHGEFYTANSPKFVKTIHPQAGIIMDDRYVGFVICTRYNLRKIPLVWNNSEGEIKIFTDGQKIDISFHS